MSRSILRMLTVLPLTVLALAAAACGRDEAYLPPVLPREPMTTLPPPDLSCEETAAPVPESLVWKRADPLATDLALALALEPDTMCRELGVIPCVEAERVALGGSDPLGTGLYAGAARPGLTTPNAVDRLVLAACAERVDRDARGPAEIVTEIDLAATALDADDPDARAAMIADATALHRRLLARDPSDAELEILLDLARAEDGLTPSAREWATLTCFAIGTRTDNLFY